MKKGKKKKKPAASEGAYTVCGEWFPDAGSLAAAVASGGAWGREGETAVDTEMRLFCACVRWAYNRLLEGKTREELKAEGQKLFGLSSRYADDAILRAQEVLNSQREWLGTQIEELKRKLAHAKKKLAYAEKDLEKARKENDGAKVDRAKRTVHGRRQRVKRLSAELAALEWHAEAGTVPRVVFGGRALWRKVCRGRATNAEWKAVRRNRLYARGDASKGGNPNVKISYEGGEFRLAVTISHLSVQDGVDSLGRPKMTEAPRVKGKLWLPPKRCVRVWDLLLSGAPYTVELIRGQDGRYRAHITFTLSGQPRAADPGLGYLGMDTNPDGVALANAGPGGQPEPWPEGFQVPHPRALHKFQGEFQVAAHPNGFLHVKIPELAYSRSHRRTYLLGVLAQVVVEIAKALGKPIAMERLEFGKDRLDRSRRFNRMASSFPFGKVAEAVARRAYGEGVSIKPVWPAHTSTIGYWKYMDRYGISVHHAAALVIARRAMGFRERMTAELKRKVAAVKEKLILKVDSLPEEGRGMTRKMRRLFGRLDGKMALHNGLDRFRQESFRSVWSDLKELALSSR